MNKEKREEINADLCPTYFWNKEQAVRRANNLADHISFLMKENEKLEKGLKKIKYYELKEWEIQSGAKINFPCTTCDKLYKIAWHTLKED